ncbi:MAG: type II toxin-antitoxin system PemK/MazF family toxin [Mycobacteriales bacterium]
MTPRPGELWLVEFTPHVGSEQAGLRPALIVSGERFNVYSPRLALVMPLTSRDRGWPTHLQLAPSTENGLTKPSWILCEQVRAASVERFRRRLGSVEAHVICQALHILNEWIFEYRPQQDGLA